MIFGVTKVRNEAHILKATLDSWATVCTGGIFVYCDACDDMGATSSIAKSHPAVRETVTSTLMDPDRERAEWWTRQLVLRSVLRFTKEEDWVVYFDGDEILEEFDPAILNDDCEMVALESYDTYITPEDKDVSEWNFSQREWVSREFQLAPYFYSCRIPLEFYKPDQRNIDLPVGSRYKLAGKVRHWGKGLSVNLWEKKCQYYAQTFGPKYAEKWLSRVGQAVKEDYKSDYGLPLVKWSDVMCGAVPKTCRNGMALIR